MIMLSLATPAVVLAPLMVVFGNGMNGTSSALYASVANLIPQRRRARFYGLFYTTNEVGTVLVPLIYGVGADMFGLNAAVIVMGLATMLILPVSLGLRSHLSLEATAA